MIILQSELHACRELALGSVRRNLPFRRGFAFPRRYFLMQLPGRAGLITLAKRRGQIYDSYIRGSIIQSNYVQTSVELDR